MVSSNKKQQSGIVGTIVEFVVILLVIFLIRTWGFGLYQVPTGSMETTMLVGERFFADKFSYLFRAPRVGEIIALNDPLYKYSTNPIKLLIEDYVWGPSNWTKRVIGIPHDVIRGVIEDGKPVIYRNNVKLDEPYLNKYPLIYLWKEDVTVLREMVEHEMQLLLQGRVVAQSVMDEIIQQKLAKYTVWKAYDDKVSLQDQPFYRIKEDRIIRNQAGEPELLYPGTPVPSRASSQSRIGEKKSYWDGSDEFYIELGKDEFWLMGDNRLGSKDCRCFGPIKRRLIHGRIVLRIWSIDSDEFWWIVDLLKHPIDFWSRVRWNRFCQWMA